jgi:hypothetical protein
MAAVQEKAAKASACDPAEKATADARMEDRVREVEAVKWGAMRRNTAAKERASALEHHPTALGVGGAAGGRGPRRPRPRPSRAPPWLSAARALPDLAGGQRSYLAAGVPCPPPIRAPTRRLAARALPQSEPRR